MIRLLIGGDICPIGGNTAFFENGDAANLFHDLLPEFTSADLVIANLECPLIDQPTPIAKTGPIFGEAAKCINGIKAAGLDVLCLANNHILDHGPRGLLSTIEVCERAGLSVVGAGIDVSAARRIVVKTVGDVRIGLLAMAEHEFSIATADTPGANPLDLIDYVRNVTHNRDAYDYLIVLLHAGLEFLTAPSPRLKNICHFIVEMGANAVVVQHPHSLGGYENYRGACVVYGQGALVMDEAVHRDLRSFHEGYLVELTIARQGSISMRPIPFVQSDPVPGAKRMDARRGEELLRHLAAKSQAILDEAFVNEEWRRYCEAHKYQYLSVLHGHNRLVRRANRRGHITSILYDQRRLLSTRNVVCCETHREALETIFKAGLI